MQQSNGAAPPTPPGSHGGTMAAGPIAITLNLEQWNAILTMLAQQPYNLSATLIAAIQQQAQAALISVHAVAPRERAAEQMDAH